MKIKLSFLLALMLTWLNLSAQTGFTARGIGGGGALFAPSINPDDPAEFYVGCDMSELFHTSNGGDSYDLLHFQQIQGGHHSRVCFTFNPTIRYCIGYANDQPVAMKSTDEGITWNTLPGNPDTWEETYFIAADYAVPNRVIIAYYASVYFSNDGGQTFNLVHSAINSGSGILVGGAFFDGNTIYLGTNDGLLVSTNGGNTFVNSNISGIPASQVIYAFAGAKESGTTRFFCLTADAANVYVDIPGSDYWDFNKGIYCLDYGTGNWTPKMNGINQGTDFPMFVAMAENNIGTVYLAGSNTNSEPDIIKSIDAGNTWSHVLTTAGNQNIATGWCGDGGDRHWSYAECPFGLSVSPSDPDMIIFSDYGFVHRSTDGGNSWTQAYISPVDQNLVGLTTPVGKSYHSVGLENTTCWQVSWINSTTLFSCFSDIKGCRSTDSGLSWNFNYTGHSQNSMYRLVQHQNGNLYAATSTVHDLYQSTRLQDNLLDGNGATGKIIFSSNQGSSWQDLHDFGLPVFWVCLDPNNTNRMYASVVNHTQGLGGIYRSDNILNGSASTWVKLPDPAGTEGHPACIVVLNDGKMVCTFSGRRNSAGAFTSSSGVFMYDPQSGNWTDLSVNGMRYWTKDIVIDPGDPLQNTWYACVFNGWGGPPNGLGGLYRTTNRGQSWTKVYSGSSVTSLTFRPATPGEAYMTTEQDGLLITNTINATLPVFTTVTDYPFRQPERVFFNPYQPGEIWVTSFGNGMQSKTLAGSTFIEDPGINYKPLVVIPNPNKGIFEISNLELPDQKYAIRIVDFSGRVIYEEKGLGSNKIKVKNLKTGIYFLEVIERDSSKRTKLIIE